MSDIQLVSRILQNSTEVENVNKAFVYISELTLDSIFNIYTIFRISFDSIVNNLQSII